MPATARPRKQVKRRAASPPRPRSTVYEIVTEKIVAALERGVVPWRRTWTAQPVPFPVKMSTGGPYRGVNVFLLYTVAACEGYRSGWWGSMRQVTKLGGKVRDEELKRHTLVVFWTTIRPKPEDAKTAEDGEDAGEGKPAKRIPVLRYYRVWNADQCDGLPAKYQEPPALSGTFAEHREAEKVMADYLSREPSLQLRHGRTKAYWDTETDVIHLPYPEEFAAPALYYSAKFHEATHSTAAPGRLNRDTEGYGDDTHVRGEEELTAEMGAAMLAAICGINWSVEENASYIQSWLDTIAGDPKMLVMAAARAQHAVEYILGITYGTDHEDPE